MDAKKIANVLLNDFKGIINKHKVPISDCGITPEEFTSLVKLLYCGVYDKKALVALMDKRVADYKEERALGESDDMAAL